jgi:hypothetical protein
MKSKLTLSQRVAKHCTALALINATFCQVALMMEAVFTSETPVYFNETTRRYISDGYHLRTRRRQKLNSQLVIVFLNIPE